MEHNRGLMEYKWWFVHNYSWSMDDNIGTMNDNIWSVYNNIWSMDNLWPLVENNIWSVNDLHGVMGIVSDLMRGCGWAHTQCTGL